MTKKPLEKSELSTQQKIGSRTMSAGRFLMAGVLVVFVLDAIGVVASDGWLSLSLYLPVIFSGVAMQFIGAAIPNMRMTPAPPNDAF